MSVYWRVRSLARARATSFRDRWNDLDSVYFHCLSTSFRSIERSSVFFSLFSLLFLIHLSRLVQLDTIRCVRCGAHTVPTTSYLFTILLIQISIIYSDSFDDWSSEIRIRSGVGIKATKYLNRQMHRNRKANPARHNNVTLCDGWFTRSRESELECFTRLQGIPWNMTVCSWIKYQSPQQPSLKNLRYLIRKIDLIGIVK